MQFPSETNLARAKVNPAKDSPQDTLLRLIIFSFENRPPSSNSGQASSELIGSDLIVLQSRAGVNVMTNIKGEGEPNIATGDGLAFTPDQAKWNMGKIIGCNTHPKTSLSQNRTLERGTRTICNPTGEPEEAHLIAIQNAAG